MSKPTESVSRSQPRLVEVRGHIEVYEEVITIRRRYEKVNYFARLGAAGGMLDYLRPPATGVIGEPPGSVLATLRTLKATTR